MSNWHIHLREYVVTWSNKAAVGDDIAPDSIVTVGESESLTVANGISIDHALTISVEVDVTAATHVCSSVDVNAYLGMQRGVRQTVRNDGLDALVADDVKGFGVDSGANWLFFTLDQNDDGNRADVVARVLIRVYD